MRSSICIISYVSKSCILKKLLAFRYCENVTLQEVYMLHVSIFCTSSCDVFLGHSNTIVYFQGG